VDRNVFERRKDQRDNSLHGKSINQERRSQEGKGGSLAREVPPGVRERKTEINEIRRQYKPAGRGNPRKIMEGGERAGRRRVFCFIKTAWRGE